MLWSDPAALRRIENSSVEDKKLIILIREAFNFRVHTAHGVNGKQLGLIQGKREGSSGSLNQEHLQHHEEIERTRCSFTLTRSTNILFLFTRFITANFCLNI